MTRSSIVLLLLVSTVASAHGLRTAFVELDEVQAGHATLHLRLSIPDDTLAVSMDAGCTLDAQEGRRTARDRTLLVACADGRIAGHTVALHGLGPVLSDAVLWTRDVSGKTQSHVLSKDAPSWTLPEARTSVVGEYVVFGVLHILSGWDHLLFLLLLVLTLGEPRRVLWAETAFTLSHSLSFTATALGWVRVAAPPAEACIALSLVLVALDVGRTGVLSSRANGPLLAFVFGLVHGLGFAGGLREIGLPEGDIASALIGFGAGVELGQIAFLVVVLALVHFASRARAWPKFVVVCAYASGAVATCWLFERLLKCFSIV